MNKIISLAKKTIIILIIVSVYALIGNEDYKILTHQSINTTQQ